jgi:SAM-dependent methyltransferase
MPEQRRPDRTAALTQYRRRAWSYDLEIAVFEPIRRRAIAALELEPGQCVLDLGCGTGLSLALLRERVQDRGRVIGVEQSAPMIERARHRVAQAGWRNVELVQAPVEEAPLPRRADAVLFAFTHDVLRNRKAVRHVFDHLAPGARVVACGLKWARPWFAPVNPIVLAAALRSVTTLEGLEQPWSELAARAPLLRIESHLLGVLFIAIARVPSG